MLAKILRSGTCLAVALLWLSSLAPAPALAAAKLVVKKEVVGGPFSSGGNVEFKITVTNNGTVPFVAVEVTDANAPACYRFLTEFDGAPTLDPGASISYTCTKYNVSGDFSNTAKGVGYTKNASGCLVASATDGSGPVSVDVTSPEIRIDKHALDGRDVQTILPGGQASFEIVVTNTGDVTLTDVAVTDPLAPNCARQIGTMVAGAVVTYTCAVGPVAKGFTNVARVTGQASNVCPGIVSASDTSVVKLTIPECALTLTKTADPSTITLGPNPDCTTAGKPLKLVWKFTGNDCSASNNNQAADKWACSGVPGTPPVSLTLIKDPNKLTVSPTSGIDVGDLITFAAIGSDMGAEVQVQIGGQFLKIHTSCSQPLAVGDVFGSLELVSFNGQTAVSPDVKYTYTMTNASTTALVSGHLTDDKLGTIADPFTIEPGASLTVTKTTQIFETTTNIATATATLKGTSTVCTAKDSATVTVQSPPGPWSCSDAKPIDILRMIWNGPQNIKVAAHKGGLTAPVVATVDNIVPGDVVNISGFAGSPNDIVWEIFAAGTNTAIGKSTFHVSCSDPDMDGPDDCGKLEGDGKGLSGYLNQWLFGGMTGLNGIGFTCQ